MEATHIEEESDYLQVVQIINSMHINNIEFGSLIDIYRKLLYLNKNCRSVMLEGKETK
jgi:hypothetical protein